MPGKDLSPCRAVARPGVPAASIAGARIVLDAGLDAARDGLAGLAGASWMMSLPRRRAAYHGHPAGRGRRGPSDDGGARLVAVTFGSVTATAADQIILPFGWEPVERAAG